MLRPDQIARMSAIQAQAMPDRMRILTITTANNAEGYPVETVAVSDEHPCRLAPVSDHEEQIVDGQVKARPEFWLTYLASAGLSNDRRVRILGLDYEVLEVQDGREWQTAGRARLRRLV